MQQSCIEWSPPECVMKMTHRGLTGNQKGNMLMAVLVIGTVSSVMLTSAVIGPVYTETAAVEAQLAELRARWAIIGDFRYAVSRAYHSKLCPNATSCPPLTKITDVNKAA